MPFVTLFYPNISGWPRSLELDEVITQRISPVIFWVVGPNILVSWPRSVWFTWRFQSRDHLRSSVTWLFDSPGAISYRCSIVTESLSPNIFEIMEILCIWVTILTFLGHVMSSVTWTIDPPYVISYWCPIGTDSLSWTVFETFASKYIWVTTLTFLGHVT